MRYRDNPPMVAMAKPIESENRFIVTSGTIDGKYARMAGLRAKGIDLYLEKRPTEIIPHKLLWHAEFKGATRMTLEEAVAYCLQLEDCWIEEVVMITDDMEATRPVWDTPHRQGHL